jgi:hypothetical protein
MNNMADRMTLSALIILVLVALIGCYSIPSDSKEFLDSYNSRHSQPPAPENTDEPLKGLKTYRPQILSYEQWKHSEHFKDTMEKGGQTAANIRHILNHIPADGVLLDGKGKEVLTFAGFVEIDPIGSIGFPVIYPKTSQKDTLSIIETLGVLQGNAAWRKLGIN